jgi:non-specific serine/threonine protein kinase
MEALGLAPDAARELESAARSQVPSAVSTVSRGTSHILPSISTRFVGRELELDSIPTRLQMTRLLTLTPVAGSGKTRLALEAGRQIASQYRDGAYLVELAPISDPSLVRIASRPRCMSS